MANQVDAVSGDLINRLKTFESSYNTIEREIRNVSTFTKSRSIVENASESSATSTISGPMVTLSQHLGSKR